MEEGEAPGERRAREFSEIEMHMHDWENRDAVHAAWCAPGAPGHGSDECGRHEEDGVQRQLNQVLMSQWEVMEGWWCSKPGREEALPCSRRIRGAATDREERKRLKAEERARRDKLREAGDPKAKARYWNDLMQAGPPWPDPQPTPTRTLPRPLTVERPVQADYCAEEDTVKATEICKRFRGRKEEL